VSGDDSIALIHQRVTPLCNVTFTDHLYFWSERLNESRKS